MSKFLLVIDGLAKVFVNPPFIVSEPAIDNLLTGEFVPIPAFPCVSKVKTSLFTLDDETIPKDMELSSNLRYEPPLIEFNKCSPLLVDTATLLPIPTPE
ncbi:hypothetical protein D3C85_451920 [compost metagenome]